MKKAAIVVAILLAGASAYTLWPTPSLGQKDAPAASTAAPAAAVKVRTLKTQPINLTQELPGRTHPFRVAEIRPQVSGIITARLFEEGSNVEQGQQLYQIDPAPYQAALDRAQADLQKAQANLKTIESKQTRYASLVKMGGVSKQEFDDITATLSQAQADIAIAEAALATAQINLDYTKVFSPIAGRIGKSAVTEGALVTANQGATLATVQQIDKIYVDVTQSVADMRQMRRFAEQQDGSRSAKARLLIEGDTAPYAHEGVLQFADVTVDQGTGTVQMRILFDNPEYDLLPGLFVKAQVLQARLESGLLVPQQAVIRQPDGSTVVWRIDADNKAQMQPIKVARTLGDQWLLESGLDDGDRVVVEGIQRLSPATPVNATEQGAENQPADNAAAPQN